LDLAVSQEGREGLLCSGGVAPEGAVHGILKGILVQLLQSRQQGPGLGLPEQLLKIGFGKITVFLKHSIASCSMG
jgi:hypothetical protein